MTKMLLWAVFVGTFFSGLICNFPHKKSSSGLILHNDRNFKGLSEGCCTQEPVLSPLVSFVVILLFFGT